MKKSRTKNKRAHPLRLNQELDRRLESSEKEFLAAGRKTGAAGKGDTGGMACAILSGVKASYAVLAVGLLTSVFNTLARTEYYGSRGLSLASNLWQIRRCKVKKGASSRNGLS